MADTKLADLTALTTPSGDDILYIVDDPAGTPLDRKIALDNLFTRGTITADAPVLNMSQTWNNAAVTFTGLKYNATDTASGAASLLMDLQVGGTSQFSVSKAGALLGPNATFEIRSFATNAINFFINNNRFFGLDQNDGFRLTNGLSVCWASSTTDVNVTRDLFIGRRAAANLRLGAADAAAPVAQTLSVQSITGTNASAAAYPFKITGAQGTGNAAGGSIIFQVAPAGGSGAAQNTPVDALIIDAGASRSVTSIFGLNVQAETSTNIISIGGGYAVTVPNNGFLRWSSTTLGTGTADLILARDDANTLALRNGANAQAFRVYGTFTDASNYTRGSFFTDTGSLVVDAQSAGTGAISQILFRVRGADFIALNHSTQSAIFYKNVTFSADNTYDIGAATATRPRSVYAATSITPGRGVTVATLPTPTTGMIARVTDATAPVIGATVAGGGAAYALVNYNGANWTVIGV